MAETIRRLKMKISMAILIIGLGLFFASPSMAQMHGGQTGQMPMDTAMMHEHMGSMADLMSEMSDVMQNGPMTAEQQAQCAGYMKRLSKLMHDLAEDPQNDQAEKRQRELKQLK
jgi:hypothetical protein